MTTHVHNVDCDDCDNAKDSNKITGDYDCIRICLSGTRCPWHDGWLMLALCCTYCTRDQRPHSWNTSYIIAVRTLCVMMRDVKGVGRRGECCSRHLHVVVILQIFLKLNQHIACFYTLPNTGASMTSIIISSENKAALTSSLLHAQIVSLWQDKLRFLFCDTADKESLRVYFVQFNSVEFWLLTEGATYSCALYRKRTQAAWFYVLMLQRIFLYFDKNPLLYSDS